MALLASCALLAGCGGHPQAAPPRLGVEAPDDVAMVEGLSPTQVVTSPDRSIRDRRLDALYQPVHLLSFLSLRPGDRVAELAGGDGYLTELLARSVGSEGRVYSRASAGGKGEGAQRRAWLERSSGEWGDLVVPVQRPWESPLPEQASGLQLVVLVGYHQAIAERADRARMNLAAFDALESGGHYVVLDHRAAPGAGLAVADSLARVEPALVREEVEVAGFNLVEVGEFLQNPQDDLKQPSQRLSVPTDRFVLKFQKPHSAETESTKRLLPADSGKPDD